MKFNELPKETQEDVKSTLCAYDECYVKQDLETGAFSVTTSIGLQAVYTNKTIMEVHKNDIYTQEEQIINYVNEFKDFPREYRGKRDYKALQLLDAEHKAVLVNGNIEII